MDYSAAEGFEIVDWRALEIPDNLEVGRHDPARLPGIVAGMNVADADVIVLSACVQMPSLPAVSQVEAETGKPVLTASIATTYAILKALGLDPVVPGAASTYPASTHLYGGHVHANGIRQHYLRYGGNAGERAERLAVIVIPGITSPAVTWGFVAEHLGRQRWGWSAMHWSATPWVAASPFVPPANSRRAWHAW
ncbi:hypothetical protein G6F57_018899 [Rhizopus arrhizus]|nr:hypothetical protein G6F57_018899 [Rhizopus arrhizus]